MTTKQISQKAAKIETDIQELEKHIKNLIEFKKLDMNGPMAVPEFAAAVSEKNSNITPQYIYNWIKERQSVGYEQLIKMGKRLK